MTRWRCLAVRILAACIPLSAALHAADWAADFLPETIGAVGARRIDVTGPPAATVAWDLVGYDGFVTASGIGRSDDRGRLALDLTLAEGWHELRLGDARLGLIAASAPTRPSDAFFAIDAALSWLATEPQRAADLTAMAARLGLRGARERIRWSAVQPQAGEPVLPPHEREVRAAWDRAGIPVLEVFHDAPAWLGRASGMYPQNLDAAAAAWASLIRGRAPGSALEVWNEPDIREFAADGAYDHLAALHHAIAWSVRSAAPGTLIGGGAMTGFETAGFRRRVWLDRIAADSDFISFHDYRDPRELEPYVRRLRQELAAAGAPTMPLWLSESGKPWPAGTPRPDPEADRATATAIALRTIEARACGLARHFAFVLPWYEERGNSFGMTGQDGSPLRSLAVYGHLARRFSGLAYLGDLPEPGARRSRVFGDGMRTAWMVWLGDPAADRRWKPSQPVTAVVGLDGRVLHADASGTYPVEDGVVVAELPTADPPLLRTDTPAMALWKLGRAEHAPAAPAPVVLQAVRVPGLAEPGAAGWTFAERAEGIPLSIAAWNCSDLPRTIQVRAIAPGGSTVLDDALRRLEIPPHASAALSWRVRAATAGSWTISGTIDGGPPLADLVLESYREPDGARLLERIPEANRRPIGQAERMGADAQIAAGSRIAWSTLPGGATRCALALGPERWAFPRIALPADLRLGDFDAAVVRARCVGRAEVRWFAYEGAAGWYTREPVFPADGEWHWAVVRFDDLRHCASTPADDSGTFDPQRVTHLSLGCNGLEDIVSIEVERMELVRLPATP